MPRIVAATPTLVDSLPRRPTVLGRSAVAAAGFGVVLFALLWLWQPEIGWPWPVAGLGGVLVFTFLAGAPTGTRGTVAPLDLLMAALTVGSLAYRQTVTLPLAADSAVTPTEYLAAGVLLFCVLEAARRVAGWPAAVGLAGWSAGLVFRPMLPEALRGDGIDAGALAMRLFAADDGLAGASFSLVLTYFLPAVLFAGILAGSGAVAVLARLLQPLGHVAEPIASLVAAPLTLHATGAIHGGRRLTFGVIAPLLGPVVGLGALLAMANRGGGFVWALAWPALLALVLLALAVRGRAPLASAEAHEAASGGEVMATAPVNEAGSALPADGLPRARDYGVLVGPAVVLVGLLIGVPPRWSFLVGAVAMATGALVRDASWRRAGLLYRGLVWAANMAVLAGALLVVLQAAGTLDSLSGLSGAVGERLFGLAPAATPVVWPLVSIAAGVVFLPWAAAAALIAIAPYAGWDTTGALVAGLFWVAAASLVAARPWPRALVGRLLWATPAALAALVVTRATFAERGALGPTLLVLDVVAAVVAGAALGGRLPMGLVARFGLLAAGILLLIPNSFVAAVGIVLLVGGGALLWWRYRLPMQHWWSVRPGLPGRMRPLPEPAEPDKGKEAG